MIEINKELVNQISKKAEESPRRRMNYNFHQQPEDTLHRMLNALQVGTYIRPHKHENPDKREAFIVLRGSVLIVEFDNSGNIIQHTILNNEKGNYGVEIPPRTIHTLISLENNTVIYEIKDGPYEQKNDKIFAPWSPEEGSPNEKEFIDNTLRKLNITI